MFDSSAYTIYVVPHRTDDSVCWSPQYEAQSFQDARSMKHQSDFPEPPEERESLQGAGSIWFDVFTIQYPELLGQWQDSTSESVISAGIT